jgi:aconitate hydratase
LEGSLQPRQRVQVRAQAHNGTSIAFESVLRLDSTVEVEYYLNGGILQTVLRHMAADA